MAVGFNFAQKPFENERLPRLVFTVTAAIVLGITLVHGFVLARYLVREQEALDITVVELREELARTDSEIQRVRSTLAREQTELGNERTQFLTRIYRHKGFSWTGLFNELEEITPPDVRITSITPMEVDGDISVTMTLVGRTLTNVLEMVSALEGSSFFATVFPLEDGEDPDALRAGESGIAATLQLQYVGVPASSPDEADTDAAPELGDDAAPPEDVDDAAPPEDVDDAGPPEDVEDGVGDPDETPEVPAEERDP